MSFDYQEHRAEMMRLFPPVDLRTGVPLTKEQAALLFSRDNSVRGHAIDIDCLTVRQAALIAAVRRGRLTASRLQNAKAQ